MTASVLTHSPPAPALREEGLPAVTRDGPVACQPDMPWMLPFASTQTKLPLPSEDPKEIKDSCRLGVSGISVGNSTSFHAEKCKWYGDLT